MCTCMCVSVFDRVLAGRRVHRTLSKPNLTQAWYVLKKIHTHIRLTCVCDATVGRG